MKELRLQSGQPGADFRLAVAVDGVNALWGRSTIKKEDKTAVRQNSSIMLRHLLFFFFFHKQEVLCVLLIFLRWIQRSSLWFIT